MLGFTAQERLADPGLWVKHLHPEDRELVLAGNGRWKVHTLPGYAYGVPDGEGIADPYGQSMSAYRASVRRIFECMDLLVPRLQVSGSR